MTFVPPFCPNTACTAHSQQAGASLSFCRRHGSFSRSFGAAPIQRYQCKHCYRHFSSQTFSATYRQKRPDINKAVFEHAAAKVTHRQSARILKVDKKTVLSRLRVFGAICREVHEHYVKRCDQRRLLEGGFLLDEAETFATSRRNNPLTVPVLIHHNSFFVVRMAVGPLPRRGGKGRDERTPPALDAVEQKRRALGSTQAVEQCIQALARIVPASGGVHVTSDMKAIYRPLLEASFPCRLKHSVTSSKSPRNRVNPLFRINLTLAMMRDAISRLVRRTWAVSKHAPRLMEHLWIWTVYRNYIRGKTNAQWHVTPAMAVGAATRKMTPLDVLRWGPQYVSELQSRGDAQ